MKKFRYKFEAIYGTNLKPPAYDEYLTITATDIINPDSIISMTLRVFPCFTEIGFKTNLILEYLLNKIAEEESLPLIVNFEAPQI